MGNNKKNRKGHQILLATIYILVICIFLGWGIVFHRYPLFNGQGFRWKRTVERPESTYEPYEASLSVAEANEAVLPEEYPDPITRFYTTERASAFTFSGLGNQQELSSVLTALEKTHCRATFFVTPEEMETHPAWIEAISRAGHSLGISVVTVERQNAAQLLNALEAQADTLRGKYGADYEIFVRPSFGSGSEALHQAAYKGGFRLMREFKEAVPETVSRMTDAEDIMAAVFRESEISLQRGEIVHFQMGLLQHDNDVLGQYIERIVEEKCVYPILPANELAEHTEFLYTYPVPEDTIPDSVRNQIYPGHLAGLTEEEIFEVIRSGYIGYWWTRSSNTLPGFTDEEIHQLDRVGLIENDQNYVFLTFDDWGSDKVVDKLLSVLREHNAIATFFVRTNYVPSNPNLLRAIAAEGHTIGAHSHQHLPLSTEVKHGYHIQLSPAECQTLSEDLVTCYNVMQSIIGDMVDADGKPSLSRLFRPPTLAVGRNGLQTVFDCGYTYAVSGYDSPPDYKAKNIADIIEELRINTRSGAILVLHFSDTAKLTAEAVDRLLSKLERYGYNYQFVGLNKVL